MLNSTTFCSFLCIPHLLTLFPRLLYPSSAPVVQSIDSESNVAKMVVTLSAAATQKAFAKACDIFNEEVKTKGYKVDGFRAGAKLPPAYILKLFSKERVDAVCAQLLSEDIQDECEKTGLKFVGRGRILQFNQESFTAGQPHTIELECDLWPEIEYKKQATGTNDGYKGLKITATKPNVDKEKYEQVKKNILERYKVLEDTPAGTVSASGDVVLVNMKVIETAIISFAHNSCRDTHAMPTEPKVRSFLQLPVEMEWRYALDLLLSVSDGSLGHAREREVHGGLRRGPDRHQGWRHTGDPSQVPHSSFWPWSCAIRKGGYLRCNWELAGKSFDLLFLGDRAFCEKEDASGLG